MGEDAGDWDWRASDWRGGRNLVIADVNHASGGEVKAR